MNYYSRTRTDLFDFIKKGNNSILEIGCGEGKTLAQLKNNKKAKYIAGVDIHRQSINKAKKVLDKAICTDIEKTKMPFRAQEFDYIILADVLEHLVDPWTTLKNLKKYLRKDGFFIVSLPNIRNIKILQKLIFQDNWQYQDKGILDKSHLRFFTRHSAIEMFKDLDLKVVGSGDNTPELNKPRRLIDFLVSGKLKPFYTIQWLFKLSFQK